MSAPTEELVNLFCVLRETDSQYLMLKIPEVKPPADGWMQNSSLNGLQDLGFAVLVLSDGNMVHNKASKNDS